MGQLSQAARERLSQERKRLASRFIITLKDFTQGTFRLLPMGDRTSPGCRHVNIFSKAMGNKGTVSFETYGVQCPVATSLTDRSAGLDKDARAKLGAVANINNEQWCPAVWRGSEGDAANPRFNILPVKARPWTQIVNYMTADEDGDDITNAYDGRDFILKAEGAGSSRKYEILKFCDATPLFPDQEMIDAMLGKYASFDIDLFVRRRAPDFGLLEEIYKLITGQPLDWGKWGPYRAEVLRIVKEAQDATAQFADDSDAEAEIDGVVMAPPTSSYAAPSSAPRALPKFIQHAAAGPAPVVQTAGVDDTVSPGDASEYESTDGTIVVGESYVTFKNAQDEDVYGLVTAEKQDQQSGDTLYVVTWLDAAGNPQEWDVHPFYLTLAEPPQEEQQTEPEPEPVPPAPAPVAVRPAPPKPAPKAPTAPVKPAAAAPAKSAPKPVAPKPAPGKAPSPKAAVPAKPPARPGPNKPGAGRPAASAAIRAKQSQIGGR